ncbi:MAG: stage V sporulation protein AD, partial [Clostridia bacterium]|nr:stage V sporulation protein AD [Clostridia bacterium]
LKKILSKESSQLAELHTDCGLLLYDEKKQDMHSGASGCGTSASVLAAHFLPLLESGKLRRILFLSTGALMNPSILLQGQPILGIAPLIRIEEKSVLEK